MDDNEYITSSWFTKIHVLSSQLLVQQFLPQYQIQLKAYCEKEYNCTFQQSNTPSNTPWYDVPEIKSL